MAIKSTFKDDLKQEQVVSEYLDKYFYDKLFKGRYERKENIKDQFKGIDVSIKHKDTGEIINIDEKAMITELNDTIPSFVFELSYLKDGNLKLGWFPNATLSTDKYMLVFFEKVDVSKHTKIRNIEQIKEADIIIVDKNKMYQYLKDLNVSLKEAVQEANYMRDNNIKRKYIKKGYLSIVSTPFLNEKPVNMVWRRHLLQDLSDLAVTVTPNGIYDTNKYRANTGFRKNKKW